MSLTITQPSSPFSLTRSKFYLNQRARIALAYVFFAFTDIITTYFGIEYFGLVENVPHTQWILEHYGWNGVLLRTLIVSILLVYFFRYIPNKVFFFVKIPAIVILFFYVGITTVNNILLMVI